MDRLFRGLELIYVILVATILFLVGTLLAGSIRTSKKIYHSMIKDGQRPFFNSEEQNNFVNTVSQIFK